MNENEQIIIVVGENQLAIIDIEFRRENVNFLSPKSKFECKFPLNMLDGNNFWNKLFRVRVKEKKNRFYSSGYVTIVTFRTLREDLPFVQARDKFQPIEIFHVNLSTF